MRSQTDDAAKAPWFRRHFYACAWRILPTQFAAVIAAAVHCEGIGCGRFVHQSGANGEHQSEKCVYDTYGTRT